MQQNITPTWSIGRHPRTTEKNRSSSRLPLSPRVQVCAAFAVKPFNPTARRRKSRQHLSPTSEHLWTGTVCTTLAPPNTDIGMVQHFLPLIFDIRKYSTVKLGKVPLYLGRDGCWGRYTCIRYSDRIPHLLLVLVKYHSITTASAGAISVTITCITISIRPRTSEEIQVLAIKNSL